MEAVGESTWTVVVPVKGGLGAKSRLRRSLDDDALVAGDLVAAIVHDTLDVAARAVGSAHVLVVTSDADEAAYARGAGHAVVGDPGHGLDAACVTGVAAARARGAGAVAILLGDHPGLTVPELRTALRVGSHHESFFVPDHEGTGTALLGSRTASVPEVAFGPGSAERHATLGHVRLELALPGLRRDVDDEPSLRQALEHLTLGPRTMAALGR